MAARNEAGAGPDRVVIVGLVPDPDAAVSAIKQLKNAGFTNQDLSVVTPRGGERGEALKTEARGDPLFRLIEGEDLDLEAETTKTGAATGGIVGGLLGLLGALFVPGLGPLTVGGVLVSTLAGAGMGAVAGGLLGMLMGMGLSQAEAEYFQSGLRNGGALVIVQPIPARATEARSILEATGADLGPAPAGRAGRREAEEPWRGNERRYQDDANFAGPERRKALA
jgi:hypothetical protein